MLLWCCYSIPSLLLTSELLIVKFTRSRLARSERRNVTFERETQLACGDVSAGYLSERTVKNKIHSFSGGLKFAPQLIVCGTVASLSKWTALSLAAGLRVLSRSPCGLKLATQLAFTARRLAVKASEWQKRIFACLSWLVWSNAWSVLHSIKLRHSCLENSYHLSQKGDTCNRVNTVSISSRLTEASNL